MSDGLHWGQGGPGVLLLHGFTGTPEDLRPFGEALGAAGYRAAAPWLAGHGQGPEALGRTSAGDWRRGAELALMQLVEQGCPAVAVLGLSLGGMLALDLAARFPVGAVVCVNPAAGVRRRAAAAAPYLWRLVAYVPTGPGPDDRLSVRAVAELLRAQRDAAALAPEVKAPALVLQSRHDPTVRPEAARRLFERIGSRKKEFEMLLSREHVPQVDAEAFVRRAAPFLAEALGGAK